MKFTYITTYKIKMWMTTGEEIQFEIDAYNERLSCEQIEYIMHKQAIYRGFINGKKDIESYDVEFQIN